MIPPVFEITFVAVFPTNIHSAALQLQKLNISAQKKICFFYQGFRFKNVPRLHNHCTLQAAITPKLVHNNRLGEAVEYAVARKLSAVHVQTVGSTLCTVARDYNQITPNNAKLEWQHFSLKTFYNKTNKVSFRYTTVCAREKDRKKVS